MSDTQIVVMGISLVIYAIYLYLFGVEWMIQRAYNNTTEAMPNLTLRDYVKAGAQECGRSTLDVQIFLASIYPGWKMGRLLHNAIVSKRKRQGIL